MQSIGCFLIVLGSITSINGSELTISTSSGREYLLEVNSEDSFHQVVNTLQNLEMNESAAENVYVSLNILDNRIEAKTKSIQSQARDYFRPLTQKEEQNISYILTTLAYQSLIKITSKKASLTKAGDQIEDVHPLKFLRYIFTNEERIVSIRNIKSRTWIWSDLINPIYESLTNEASLNNITDEQVENLAAAVKIDPNLLFGQIHEKNWAGLVDTLISNAPRNGDSRRYDM